MTAQRLSYPDQIVCMLPVDGPLVQDEILPLLPSSHRRREWFDLRDYFPPEIRRQTEPSAPIDWLGLAQAMASMLSAASGKLDANRITEYHIASRAPLSLVALMGYQLQGFTAKHVFHNRTRSEEWLSFRLSSSTPTVSATGPAETEFFTTRPTAAFAEGQQISEASGWVALCISLLGPADRTAVRKTLPGELADIVELSVNTLAMLTPTNLGVALAEIRTTLSMIKSRYQQAKGVALFFAGPAPLAFFIGRELNPKAMPNGAARLYDFRPQSKSYELAYELPLTAFGTPEISQSAESVLARRNVFDNIKQRLDEFIRTVQSEDFPAHISAREEILGRIQSLRLPQQPSDGDTRLTLMSDQLELGDGLLEALLVLSEEQQRQVGLLFLLHEVLHFDQNLVHGNHRKVGQAAVVLGQIDFIADVFSVEVAVRWTVRRGGPKALEEIAALTEGFITAYVRGVEAFDRLEQKDMLRRLFERRLRRYLTWYLQRERSKSLRTLDDLHALCKTQLVVELAPLRGFLDSQYEKLVDGVLPTTRLMIACEHELLAVPQSPHFNPALLLDAVRHFRHEDVLQLMRHIVEPKERRTALCPWRTPKT